MYNQRQLTLDFQPKFEAVGAGEVFHHLRLCNSAKFIEALKQNGSDVVFQLVAAYLKKEREKKKRTGLRNKTEFEWRVFERPERMKKVLQ